jgi:hypothetical protein
MQLNIIIIEAILVSETKNKILYMDQEVHVLTIIKIVFSALTMV